LIISIEILCLLFFSWLAPYLSFEINFKLNVSKKLHFWNTHIKNINLLPVRGIILREFLSLWRENKKFIFRIVLSTTLLNIAITLFIVNNGKTGFFIWTMLLQVFIFLPFVINYSTLNNINLMNSVLCKEFYILIGEFVFWFTLFLIYFAFTVLFYSFILTKISIISIIITILLFAVSLSYILLVRLAYADNELTRTVIVAFSIFIPITIPFYMYNSYRRLKC